MGSKSSVAARVAKVRERIEAACLRSGRAASSVTLVAVTKTHPPEAVAWALAAGLRDVGENRVQELEAKVEAVGRDAVRWHLIGTLQRNKARKALPLFDLLHSLDSVRLAEKLSEEATAAGRTARALVQVNVSGEGTKSGFAPAEAPEAVGQICSLPGLRVEGLMTMAPFVEEEAVLRRAFSAARRLAEELARQLPGFRGEHLSMGMSNDFEVAVEEGSTLVRLGTVLFGDRGQ
jgi:PLP dependent protein